MNFFNTLMALQDEYLPVFFGGAMLLTLLYVCLFF